MESGAALGALHQHSGPHQIFASQQFGIYRLGNSASADSSRDPLDERMLFTPGRNGEQLWRGGKDMLQRLRRYRPMKKVSELAMFTLFFSSLSGLGFTAGVCCFFGIARLLARTLA